MVRGSGRSTADRRPVPRGTAWDAVQCGPVQRLVPPAGPLTPVCPLAVVDPARDHPGMEVISPSRPANRPSVGPIVTSATAGTFLIVLGLTLAYVAFATPTMAMLLPGARADPVEMAVGMVAWTIALIAPAACLLLGTNRLARMLAAVRGRVGRRSAAAGVLDGLPDDVVVASGLILPDGRPVPDLIVGPFGAAVVRELPPAAAVRIKDGQWHLHTQRGWITLEDPLSRTVRDSERVRRWLAHDDADFVVKVYAAVISRDLDVARTTACAVVRPDQLAAWVAALPPQRSLTQGRRERMIDRVRHTAG
jgi:hypothetical protein